MKLFNISLRKTSTGWSLFVPNRKYSRSLLSEEIRHFQIAKETISPIKLNVGGGKGHPKVEGWTVVDMRSSADVLIDISQMPLPYKNDSVDVIFCSHTLEHIIPQRLDFVLSEFFRVLSKTNSLLRVSVPDIEVAVKAYLAKDEIFFDHSEIAPIYPDAPLGGKLASWFYSTRFDRLSNKESKICGHVHCFDHEYMIYRLRQAGFQQVWRCAPRSSAFHELRGKAFDRHLMESLFIEAMP